MLEPAQMIFRFFLIKDKYNLKRRDCKRRGNYSENTSASELPFKKCASAMAIGAFVQPL